MTEIATQQDIRGASPAAILAAGFLAGYREPTRSHYTMIVNIDGYLTASPVQWVKRPTVPRRSTTNGLTRPELLAVLELAKEAGSQDHAIMSLDAGADARSVQKSVGHADIRMTSYYDRSKDSLAKNTTHLVAAFLES